MTFLRRHPPLGLLPGPIDHPSQERASSSPLPAPPPRYLHMGGSGRFLSSSEPGNKHKVLSRIPGEGIQTLKTKQSKAHSRKFRGEIHHCALPGPELWFLTPAICYLWFGHTHPSSVLSLTCPGICMPCLPHCWSHGSGCLHPHSQC